MKHPVDAVFTAIGDPTRRAILDELTDRTGQTLFERLTAAGVRFVQDPTDLGSVTVATFDDTCGNLIQITAMT